MSPMKSPIYLDYHATTPMEDRVVESMLPYFSTRFGNAASRSHSYGWQAAEAVDIARRQVGELLQVDDRDITFTSGATEGLNFLLKGTAESLQKKGKHIITIATEHHAVLDTLDWLKTKGFEITTLPVNRDGRIDFDLLQQSIRKDILFISAMWANNETGVIHEMATIGRLCANAGIPLICDATQAVGKIKVSPVEVGIDMMVFSGHKIYGPKGIGAVYINPHLKFKPTALIHGGGHENGLRSGTLNVPAIVGLGTACQIIHERLLEDEQRISDLRDYFEIKVLAALEETEINGNREHRLPTVSNLCVRYVDSQSVMTKFRTKLAISSGSACSSADPSPSHVLLAMGLTENEAKGSFRFSFGRPTTQKEVDEAATIFIDAVKEYRSQSPAWGMHLKGIDVDSLDLR